MISCYLSNTAPCTPVYLLKPSHVPPATQSVPHSTPSGARYTGSSVLRACAKRSHAKFMHSKASPCLGHAEYTHKQLISIVDEDKGEVGMQRGAENEQTHWCSSDGARGLQFIPLCTMWGALLTDLGIVESCADHAMREGDVVLSELMSLATAEATDFEYLRFVAQGCNAIVVEARCTKPGHPFPGKLYAIKVIYNMHGLTGQRMRELNRHEFEMLRDLWSLPTVVRLWRCFVAKIPPELQVLFPDDTADLIWGDGAAAAEQRAQTWFAVFDAHATDLARFRTIGPPVMDFPVFITLAKSVCQALLDLRMRGILHRDVKLNNFLRKADGTVCLCDFGEAQRVVSISSVAFHTPS